MFNFSYLWLSARLRLLPRESACSATFAGIKFLVAPRHYQLRAMLKSRSIQRVLDQILGLCDSQTLFLDIGANIGIFSLLVSSETGAYVIAFEPVSTTFQALIRNLNSNPCLKITPLNLALGSTSNFIDITAVSCSGTNQVSTVAEREGEPFESAYQLSLDQLGLESSVEKFKKIVVKIDVERYEFEVLRGMQYLLALNIPIAICVEVDCMQESRIQSILPPGFRRLAPPQANCSRFKVQSQYDPLNIFYVNKCWN